MIDKVGAIILDGNKMLVARTTGKNLFFIPGGRREGGESDEECLRREIAEELGVEIEEMRYYGEFITPASGDPDTVMVKAYFCRINGKPKPNGEIAEIKWIDKNSDKRNLGNVLKMMVPEMVKDGFL